MNTPRTTEASLRDKYDQMMLLADLFEGVGTDMRSRAGLGEQVLRDPAVGESALLAPATWARLDEAVRAATTGKHGLLARSVELDADALIVRATVLTYRWIDELQDAAYRTLGSVAGRAIGYLAPEVALGGAVVSAGLIETDALDRDDVTAYLDDLAENNPDLLDHVTNGGGLLDGLRLRSLLTTPVLAADTGPAVARGGIAAIGDASFPVDLSSALRDVAVGVVDRPEEEDLPEPTAGDRPIGLEGLMTALFDATRAVNVRRLDTGVYLALLPGPQGRSEQRLRLVGGDHLPYADRAVRAIEAAIRKNGDADDRARVLLVGSGQGGQTALDIAGMAESALFEVDRVVTAGAPSALVPRVPRRTRMLSLEDRTDPVALLGSLVNAGADNRLTVVFDGSGSDTSDRYVAGARLADLAEHAEIRAEIASLRELGYLA